MSVKAMTWVFENSCASGSNLLVLLILADHADDQAWSCWPGLERIAALARMSERAVRYCLRKLEDLGELKVFAPNGSHRTNTYQIVNISGGQSLPPTRQSLPGTRKRASDQPGSGLPVNPEAGCPLIISESSEEPSEHSCASQTDARPLFAQPENHEPDPNDSVRNGDGNRTGTAEPEDFEGFWQAYPRKVGKKPASVAYKRCRNRHGSTTILQGLGRWLAYWDDPQFIPYPATFLNREQYLEEPPARRARGVAGALEEYLSS